MPDPDAQNDSAVDIEVGGGVRFKEPTATEGTWATPAASEDKWASAPGTSAGDAW